MAGRNLRAATALAAAAVFGVSACGVRVDHAAIVAAAGGGGGSTKLVTLAPGATALPGGDTATGGALASSAPGAGGDLGGVPGAGTGGATTGSTTPGGASVPTAGSTAAGVQPTTAGGKPAKTAAATATGAAGQSSAAAASGKTDTSPVTICQVGHFSGIAAPPQANAQAGLSAWVHFVNAHGGLEGHPVKLDSKDDAMDPNKAQQIVQNCVENEHAVAVVAAFVPATVDSIAPYLSQQKVPVIGGDGTTSTWFTNPDFFPEGSSSLGTGEGQAHIMVAAGKKAAGVVFCTENVACQVGSTNFTQGAKDQGIPIKGSYQVSLASPTFTSQCTSMKSAGIDAVYLALDGASDSRFARDCSGIGYTPLIVAGGLAVDPATAAQDPNLDGMTITTSVFPWMLGTTPAMKDFQTAMATYAPGEGVGESGAKAWVSGQLLAKAVANAGSAATSGPITSAMILDGLHKMNGETLNGLVMGKLTFPAGQPAVGNVCWGEAQLKGGTWGAPIGATVTCH